MDLTDTLIPSLNLHLPLGLSTRLERRLRSPLVAPPERQGKAASFLARVLRGQVVDSWGQVIGGLLAAPRAYKTEALRLRPEQRHVLRHAREGLGLVPASRGPRAPVELVHPRAYLLALYAQPVGTVTGLFRAAPADLWRVWAVTEEPEVSDALPLPGAENTPKLPAERTKAPKGAIWFRFRRVDYGDAHIAVEVCR
jgi:hypothetical protein